MTTKPGGIPDEKEWDMLSEGNTDAISDDSGRSIDLKSNIKE